MIDIADVPDAELEADRVASVIDAAACSIALQIGVLTYHDGESVVERLQTNLAIVRRIAAEQERRRGQRSVV